MFTDRQAVEAMCVYVSHFGVCVCVRVRVRVCVCVMLICCDVYDMSTSMPHSV